MKNYLRVRYLLPIVIIFVVLVTILVNFLFRTPPEYVTTRVERGSVSEIVSVSGFVEADKMAELNFAVGGGVVTGVFVEEGDVVEKGEILASLSAEEVVAEKYEVTNTLAKAIAEYELLLGGPRDESVLVAESKVEKAAAELVRLSEAEDVKVRNAWLALLRSNLEAASTDINEEATPPLITGTYNCEVEGRYKLEVYSSKAQSGYSYRLSGLEESGGATISTDQPAPLGECGLYAQFSEVERYHNSTWVIEIPNQRSFEYTTLKNAFDLAVSERDKVIVGGTNALVLAEREAGLSIADSRAEEIRAGLAKVEEARARLSAVNARLAYRSIVAPFSGVITHLDLTEGEVTTNNAVITLLSPDAFSLTARVPEIDVTKIQPSQKVSLVFDANEEETVLGEVRFVSPNATMIDGVAYFETKITFSTPPPWLRSGLNADVDIFVEEKTEVLRLPKRFIGQSGQSNFVLQKIGTKIATTTITVEFFGNDGFAAIKGLNEGDEVIAP
jgi:multidrug efflux pump subunit AcrA (membrane-fusion protein)